MSFNILVLHGLGRDPSRARGTSLAQVRSFEQFGPQHRYLYQDITQPVTQALRSFHFDAILIDGTFLCWRWVRPRFLLDDILQRYEWVSSHPAVKLAFPQDDYDHAHVLDRWLASWHVDHVYTVCRHHHQDLYPILSRQPGMLSVALTGYVEAAAGSAARRAIASRDVLVGYRARNLPAWFGRLGRLKAEVAEVFAEHAVRRGIPVDVSTDPADVLVGPAWSEFLSRSRFTLGCESGSSLLDPEGHLRDAVQAYVAEHPAADFDEIESAVFPGQDGRLTFSAVSPRLFEAASSGSCQILVEGEYLPELRAGEHYIELKRDWSNLDDVLASLGDVSLAQRIADACLEAIVLPPTYRYGTRVAETFGRIDALLGHPARGVEGAGAFDAMRREHAAAARLKQPLQDLWQRARVGISQRLSLGTARAR